MTCSTYRKCTQSHLSIPSLWDILFALCLPLSTTDDRSLPIHYLKMSALFQNRQKMFYRNFITEFSKPSFNTLANSDFHIDYFDHMENAARNDNCIFVGHDGKLIRMMLFREITHSSLGTQLDCKGNHYMSTDNVCRSLFSTIRFTILYSVHRQQIKTEILPCSCKTDMCDWKHQHSIRQHLQWTTDHFQ